MTTEPIAVDPRTAARMLGIGVVKLYMLMSEGEIKGRKVGRRTLIRTADLEAYVDGLPVAEYNTMGRGRAKSAA